MQRRQFLQKTLALGTAALFPKAGVPAKSDWLPPAPAGEILYGALEADEICVFEGMTMPLRELVAIPWRHHWYIRESQEPIVESALARDWLAVKECLQRDPSLINITGDYDGYPGCNLPKLPLFHLAALLNPDIEFLKYLVSQGADIHALSEYGGTPIHYAARNSTVEVLEYLISLGVSLHAKNKIGGTALHYAAAGNSRVDVLQYLVNRSFDVKARDDKGWTPLHEAAKGNPNIEVLQYLVSLGANVLAKNADGKIPCCLADSKEKKLFFFKAMGFSPSEIEYLSRAMDEKIRRQVMEAEADSERRGGGEVLSQEEVENLLSMMDTEPKEESGKLSPEEVERLLSGKTEPKKESGKLSPEEGIPEELKKAAHEFSMKILLEDGPVDFQDWQTG